MADESITVTERDVAIAALFLFVFRTLAGHLIGEPWTTFAIVFSVIHFLTIILLFVAVVEEIGVLVLPYIVFQLIDIILMMYASARDLLGLDEDDTKKMAIEGEHVVLFLGRIAWIVLFAYFFKVLIRFYTQQNARLSREHELTSIR